MAYKTLVKEEIKEIGYDLLARSVEAGYDRNYLLGIVTVTKKLLSKFDEKDSDKGES